LLSLHRDGEDVTVLRSALEGELAGIGADLLTLGLRDGPELAVQIRRLARDDAALEAGRRGANGIADILSGCLGGGLIALEEQPDAGRRGNQGTFAPSHSLRHHVGDL